MGGPPTAGAENTNCGIVQPNMMPGTQAEDRGPADQRLIDCYIKLYELEQNERNSRMEYQWKINFGLWAALVAAFASDVPTRAHLNTYVAFGGFVVLWVVYSIWTFNLHARNQTNRNFMDNCRGIITDLLDGRSPSRGLLSYSITTPFEVRNWSLVVELTVMTFLTVLCIFE
jgi:hypothetical protein